MWPLVQGAAAATIAWLIATLLVGHPAPFFAAISAFIALNTALGQRGLNAVRLLVGVVIGIAVGELALGLLGHGAGALAIAVLTATTLARASGGSRIAIGQAASSAILTVATGEHIGLDRLIDALIGAGVALSFSQFLFSPEPVALLRRIEAEVLRDLGHGLDLAAQALDAGDDALGAQAISSLWGVQDRLAELGRTRVASARTARHSLVWRGRMAPVVRESENAAQLGLLAGSCLMLARSALAWSGEGRRKLAPAIGGLATILTDLAATPGARETRQATADRAMDVAGHLEMTDVAIDSPMAPALVAVQVAIADLLAFAGVDPDEAVAAVRAGAGAFTVPEPPATRPTPLGWVSRGVRWMLRNVTSILRGMTERLPGFLRRTG